MALPAGYTDAGRILITPNVGSGAEVALPQIDVFGPGGAGGFGDVFAGGADLAGVSGEGLGGLAGLGGGFGGALAGSALGGLGILAGLLPLGGMLFGGGDPLSQALGLQPPSAEQQFADYIQNIESTQGGQQAILRQRAENWMRNHPNQPLPPQLAQWGPAAALTTPPPAPPTTTPPPISQQVPHGAQFAVPGGGAGAPGGAVSAAQFGGPGAMDPTSAAQIPASDIAAETPEGLRGAGQGLGPYGQQTAQLGPPKGLQPWGPANAPLQPGDVPPASSGNTSPGLYKNLPPQPGEYTGALNPMSPAGANYAPTLSTQPAGPTPQQAVPSSTGQPGNATPEQLQAAKAEYIAQQGQPQISAFEDTNSVPRVSGNAGFEQVSNADGSIGYRPIDATGAQIPDAANPTGLRPPAEIPGAAPPPQIAANTGLTGAPTGAPAATPAAATGGQPVAAGQITGMGPGDTLAQAPGGGAAGGTSFWDKLVGGATNSVTNNPLGIALAGGLLGYNLLRGDQKSDPQKVNEALSMQAMAQGGHLLNQGQEMQNYLLKGNLPPALEAQNRAMQQQGEAQSRAAAAHMGVSADPTENSIVAGQMQQAALNANQAKIAQEAAIAQQGVQWGQLGTQLTEMGLQNNMLLAQMQGQQDQAMQQAIGRLAAAFSPPVNINFGNRMVA